MIMVSYMNRIDTINSQDCKASAASWWDQVTVINNEDVVLQLYILYLSLMIHYQNIIDGTLIKFILCISGSKIIIKLPMGETHV